MIRFERGTRRRLVLIYSQDGLMCRVPLRLRLFSSLVRHLSRIVIDRSTVCILIAGIVRPIIITNGLVRFRDSLYSSLQWLKLTYL